MPPPAQEVVVGVVKDVHDVDLDRKRRDLPPLRQLQLEERLGHERRREQIRRETKQQREREAANRSRAELQQEQRTDDGRNVGIEQGQEHASETRVDRGANTAAGLELLLDALEDQ